ncbi:hypothetical protein VPNG_00105 [Cytospora leucostoma]|uniref:FAD-binding domain-containing protein n=1 Tax=Cytospora leucostoma TaxID=1230097 RepID=A0A423XNL2_9PEZI|nr:hypothetical protein VPNG_00105 [Cytospora leucostoma]
MSTGKDFRVLIAGGSIAGLSLALALEQHGIDFLVLEGHAAIAPQAGASIAVLPSGFRVLDQLGCYEDVMALVNCTIDNFVIRAPDGRALVHVADLEEHLVHRHGYPMVFFERRMLIEVLYRNLRQKEKVLTSKRVIGSRQDAGGVSAECEDGTSYEGSMLVGADGVHSAVGREMARTGGGGGAAGGDGLPVQYRCLFGISDRVPGVGEDTLHHVTNHGSSLFAASGPDDRTYWCLFTGLGETYYGDALPPYGEEDEAETVAKHGNDAVTETVRFRDLYERRLVSFNPIIGLGGMNALETTAALTNHLVALLKSSESPSTAELESVFARTQDSRRPRAQALVDVSKQTQHRFAMRTPWLSLMNRYYYPAIGSGPALRWLTGAYPGAVGLETKKEKRSDNSDVPGGEKGKTLPDWLPKPTSHALPYEDELLHRPEPRSILASGSITSILAGLAALGVYLLLHVGHVNGTFRLVDEAVWQGAVDIPGRGMTDLRQVFGRAGWLSGLNRPASTLVAVFLPLIAGSGSAPAVLERKLQAGYFLLSVVFPVLAVVSVEGSRKRNTWSPMWSPTSWLMAAQLLGLGLVLPLYVLALYRSSSHPAYWMPAERFVPRAFSRAIIPALVLGFLVPCALVAGPTTFTWEYAQESIALWQISPVLVSLAADWISGFLAGPRKVIAGGGLGEKKNKAPLEDYKELDVAGLKRLYNFVFVVASAAHTAILLALVWTPGLSVAGAFVPHEPRHPVADIAEGVGIFLKLDLLLTVASMLVWCSISCAESRRVGADGMPLLKNVGLLVAGSVLFGPGAAFIAFWKRREMKVARPELRV